MLSMILAVAKIERLKETSIDIPLRETNAPRKITVKTITRAVENIGNQKN